MNEITLPFRQKIRNSSPGGLRPSTLPHAPNYNSYIIILIFLKPHSQETADLDPVLMSIWAKTKQISAQYVSSLLGYQVILVKTASDYALSIKLNSLDLQCFHQAS